MKTMHWIVMAAMLAPCVPPAAAQPNTTEEKLDQARARLDQLKERLNLTPEQTEQVRPVVTEELQQLKILRDKYSGDQSRRSRLKMAREARDIRNAADVKLKNILTKPQMDELKKIRDEQRDEFRERRR
jgi:hypothetical protein